MHHICSLCYDFVASVARNLTERNSESYCLISKVGGWVYKCSALTFVDKNKFIIHSS